MIRITSNLLHKNIRRLTNVLSNAGSAPVESSENWIGFNEFNEPSNTKSIFESIIDESYQSEALPKELTRREFYMHDDEVKIAKTLGIGVASQKIESHLFDLLLKRSSSKTSLSNMNISLFNFHTLRFALRLIEANVGSLCLVESSLNYATLSKEFARNARKEGWKVEAYRANFDALFPVYTHKRQVKLPAKLLFASKSLVYEAINPFSLKIPRNTDDECGEVSNMAPIVIGIMPTVNLQSAMINSFLSSLILHLTHMKLDTIFIYGGVQLITFLSAGNFAALFSSVNPSLKFLSRVQRHYSWLFNRLFDLFPLEELDACHRTAFSPIFPLCKPIAHEKKLLEVGIKNGYLYGVSIRPKNSLKIGKLLIRSDVDDNIGRDELVHPSEVLMKYAFWMHLTGKLAMNVKILDKLKIWFPDRKDDLINFVDERTKVADLDFNTFDELFVEFYDSINERNFLNCDYAKFAQKLAPKINKEFVD